MQSIVIGNLLQSVRKKWGNTYGSGWRAINISPLFLVLLYFLRKDTFQSTTPRLYSPWLGNQTGDGRYEIQTWGIQ